MKKRGIFRRAANAFFAAIGFLTVLGLTLGGIVIYVGMEKQGKSLADLFSLKRDTVETYTGERPALPSLEKISERQAANAQPAPPRQLTNGNGTAQPAKPIAYSTPSKKQTTANGDEYGICPSCKKFHNLSKSCADDRAFVDSTVKPSKAKQKIRNGKHHGQQSKQAPAKTYEATSAVTWQTADYTPGVGRTVGCPKFGDISKMSDLEKQAAYSARNEKAWKELENATAAARGGN